MTGRPLIEYDDVEIRRKELVVLKHVNLTVAAGEFLYLMGPVGSGKSSLLKTVYHEVPVAAGAARVLDFDLTAMRRRDVPMLRRNIGIVFQDFRLLTDRSVYHNLQFVLRATGWRDPAETDSRIEEVLKEVGMLSKSYKMPYELSGGEQQRIVIARALLNKPPLILADEPTGNLDSRTGEQIVALLHDISRSGKTAVIMATHNVPLARSMPARVVTCGAKALTEEESPGEQSPAG